MILIRLEFISHRPKKLHTFRWPTRLPNNVSTSAGQYPKFNFDTTFVVWIDIFDISISGSFHLFSFLCIAVILKLSKIGVLLVCRMFGYCPPPHQNRSSKLLRAHISKVIYCKHSFSTDVKRNSNMKELARVHWYLSTVCHIIAYNLKLQFSKSEGISLLSQKTMTCINIAYLTPLTCADCWVLW